MSTVEVKIDMSAIKAVIKSDELWKFAANEWHKAYFDYVPHDTNMLRNNVEVKPKEIEHESPYSAWIYNGINTKAKPRRPLILKNGCAKWDVKAKQDKKDLLVVRSMQEWIKKNI